MGKKKKVATESEYDLRGEWCRITGVSLQQAYADIRSGIVATGADGRIDYEATLRNVRQTRRVKTPAELQEAELDIEIKRTRLNLERARLAEVVQEIQDEALAAVHNGLTVAIAEFAAESKRSDVAKVAARFRKIIQRVIDQTRGTDAK